MRRPAPRTLADIRHPGPQNADRHPHAPCRAAEIEIDLADGQRMLEALGCYADAMSYGSAVLSLAGLRFGPFDYVMPDRAIDDRHAAWYSDTRSSNGAVLEDAVAVLGWRDGIWFAHIHAYWHENGQYHLGHLLPDTLVCDGDARISGYGLQGARFVAAPDPETEFTLFRIEQDHLLPHGTPVNALIATLAPFEDLHEAVDLLGRIASTPTYEVHGLGSLAGAQFLDTDPMTGLISEILIAPTAGRTRSEPLALPVRCVDLDGKLHNGTLAPGRAPTLVTCELLLTFRS